MKILLFSDPVILFSVPRMLIYTETQYVIDRLDEVCRIVFPISYLLIQFSYFSYYFYIAEDI